MESLPDWLQVVLALAGLFGGPAAGVYYGGVRRTRLDDRRELLKEWLPWVADIFKDYPPGGGDNLRDALKGMSVKASQGSDALRDMNLLVRQLPWQDRLRWHRVLEGLIEVDPEMFCRWALLTGEFRDLHAQSPAKDSFQARYEMFYRSVMARQREHIGLTTEFESYLLRKVNPTAASRWIGAWRTVQLVIATGPRRWFRVQPLRISVVAVANQLAPNVEKRIREEFSDPRMRSKREPAN